ncbi:unnamed protein product [Chironomus riparius]|uniref:Sugar transporter SWEET n=1 Tax=Chironomus riparius TaxID=315576 RepID=A0A9N9WYF3_9DIPT|nr:unnamed protein product [Chironomus riparius]
MTQLDVIFKDIAQTLLPYTGFIDKSAAWLGVLQIVSPAFVLNGIRKNRENNKIPVFPFLFVAIYMVLSLRYAQIINNQALYDSNLKGLAFSAVYLTIYYYLCPQQKKKENVIYISSGAALCTFIYYYSVNADPSTIAAKYETIMTSVLWSFHFIALLGVYAGFAGKTSSHLALEMSSASALMGANRICYGILKNRQFIVFQNIIFLAVNLGQLSCFVFFSSKTPPKKVKTEEGKSSGKKRMKKE